MRRALGYAMAAAALAGCMSVGWSAPRHYRFDMQWGEYGAGNGQFYSPMRLNIRGNYLLVGDRDNNRVQMFTLDGTFVRKYGSYGRGINNLWNPFEADFDNAGNVFISDFGNGRIVVRALSFAYERMFGSEGRNDDQMMGSRALAVDREHNWLYIADTLNDRNSKWTTAGQVLFTFGATGTGPSQFDHPYDVAVGPGGVYVADTNNNRIQQFDSEGNFIRQWDGSAGGGRLNWPPALAVAPNGNVFVADGDNARVVQYSATGEFISAFGGYGSGPGQFDMPAGVAVDGALRVYVSDGHEHRMQRFRLNRCPTVPTQLTITPPLPGDGDSLTATATGSLDADGDALVYGYRWYHSADGATWSALRNARLLPASMTQRGRWYRFAVRAWDGYDYSAWATSSAVLIPGP